MAHQIMKIIRDVFYFVNNIAILVGYYQIIQYIYKNRAALETTFKNLIGNIKDNYKIILFVVFTFITTSYFIAIILNK